jgi:hypothetical protein
VKLGGDVCTEAVGSGSEDWVNTGFGDGVLSGREYVVMETLKPEPFRSQLQSVWTACGVEVFPALSPVPVMEPFFQQPDSFGFSVMYIKKRLPNIYQSPLNFLGAPRRFSRRPKPPPLLLLQAQSTKAQSINIKAPKGQPGSPLNSGAINSEMKHSATPRRAGQPGSPRGARC